MSLSKFYFLQLPTYCAFTCSFGHNSNWNVQAPVSDREYRATLPETAAMIDLASSMIAEGRGSELMPREADPSAPTTAYRWACNCIVICLVQQNVIGYCQQLTDMLNEIFFAVFRGLSACDFDLDL